MHRLTSILVILMTLALASQAWTRPRRSGPTDEQRKEIAESIAAAHESLKKLEPGAKSGYRRGRIWERIGDLERRRGRPVWARKAYRQALDAFASAGSERSRSRLLRRLSRRGREWSREAAEIFSEIRDGWKKIKRLRYRARRLRRRREPPDKPSRRIQNLREQLEEVRKLAQSHKDIEMQAWVAEVNGRLAAAEGRPGEEPEKYLEAAALCDREACPRKRTRLLIAAAWALERLEQLAESFKIHARLNAESIGDLPKHHRQYARSREMVRICKKLLKKSEDASCRDLERQTVGFVTYWDFSRGRPRSQLSYNDIREVHEEYVPLLSQCLVRAVKSGEAEPGETYKLSWTIHNNGTAKNLECWPATDEYNLGTCFQEALGIFRYPRYRGQRQNITLPLQVEGNRFDPDG